MFDLSWLGKSPDHPSLLFPQARASPPLPTPKGGGLQPPLPPESQPSTGYGRKRQAGDWGVNSRVQSPSHCRYMMGQKESIMSLGADILRGQP